ncbi:MAG: hypothetical protein K6T75_01880 [Acetobacteraceae bacterium]|nr:hypothetical protein [Acetobacteraceae bacterium]
MNHGSEVARLKLLLREPPERTAYPTVDEVLASVSALARQCPDARVYPLCCTRRGETVPVVQIGEGGLRVLAIGFPHSNEAAGAVALDWLAWCLARSRELREALGCTWYMIVCLDPDAARLNHSFFRRPDSLLSYALGYFRQPATDQPEWSFPVRYRTLTHDRPTPESRALAELIDRVRPQVFFSLHNSNLSGVHYWLMDPAPRLHPVLQCIPQQAGLPLHLGEPQHALAREIDRAIYKWTAIAEVYEYFAAYHDGDPADLVGEGMSAEEYARERCGAFVLVTELPYFVPTGGFDTAPAGPTRRDIALEEVEACREHYAFLDRLVQDAAPWLSPAYVEAHRRTMRRLLDTLRARERCIGQEAEYSRPATRAEALDRRFMHRVSWLLQVGVFLRVIEGRLRRLPDEEAERLARVKDRALRWLVEEEERIRREVPYHPTPIREATVVQVAAMLAAVDYVRSR